MPFADAWFSGAMAFRCFIMSLCGETDPLLREVRRIRGQGGVVGTVAGGAFDCAASIGARRSVDQRTWIASWSAGFAAVGIKEDASPIPFQPCPGTVHAIRRPISVCSRPCERRVNSVSLTGRSTVGDLLAHYEARIRA